MDQECLVLDLSTLNHFIMVRRIKMLMVAEDRLHLCRGFWLVKLDLENMYSHVLVNLYFQKLLVIQMDEFTIQFTVVPLRLNIVPQVFTKMTKMVSSKLSQLRIDILLHLDNWMIQV